MAARKQPPQPTLYNPQPFQPPAPQATAPQVPVPIQQMNTPLVETPADWPRYEDGNPKAFEDMSKEEADYCLDTFKTVDPKSAVANESIDNRLTSIAQGKPIYSAWQAQDATVYDAIIERFGASDKLKMTSLRRVMPDPDHLVPPSMPSVPSHAAFVQWLRDNCWTGNREKFQYGLRLGAHHLFTGGVEFSDNEIQKAIYRRRVEEAGRPATPRPGTPGGALLPTHLQPGPPQLAAPPPAAPPSGISIQEAIQAERAKWEAERAAEQRERGLLDKINQLQQQLERPAAPAAAPALPSELASVLGRIEGRLAQLENGPAAASAPSRQPPPVPDNWPDPPEGHVWVWNAAKGKHECRRLNAEPHQAPVVVEARPAAPPPVPDNWPDPPEGHVYVWNQAKGKHECRRLNAEPSQATTALVHAPAPAVEVAKPQSITDMVRQVVNVADETKTALNLLSGAVGGDPLFAPPAKAAAALAASPAEPEAKPEKEKQSIFHEEGGLLFRKDAKGNPLMSMEDVGVWDIAANGPMLGKGIEWLTEFLGKKKAEDAELTLKNAEAAKAAEEAKALALRNQLLEQEVMAKRAETVLLQKRAAASLQGSTATEEPQVSSGEPPST